MASLLDYIDWRGDISFQQVPLNEVDALILARFVYLHLENYVPISFDTYITIEELYSCFKHESETYLIPEDKPMFEKLAKSKRFKHLKLSGLAAKLHKENEEQFCAVCIEDPSFTYISFRGTDSTLIGWKEDFNLSFMPQIPSQHDAVNYVNTASRTKKNLILGGHSKGGNLAIYAGIFCNADILQIYNFDGPGFDQKTIAVPAFRMRLNLIQTFIPQFSIIGMILNHPEKCHIVKSTIRGPRCHDVFTWEVMASKINKAAKLSEQSRFIANTMEKFRTDLSVEDRQQLVDTIFNMVVDEPSDTVAEWKSKWYSTVKNSVNEYMHLDADSRDQITDAIFQLLDSARSTFTDMTKKGEN